MIISELLRALLSGAKATLPTCITILIVVPILGILYFFKPLLASNHPTIVIAAIIAVCFIIVLIAILVYKLLLELIQTAKHQAKKP